MSKTPRRAKPMNRVRVVWTESPPKDYGFVVEADGRKICGAKSTITAPRACPKCGADAEPEQTKCAECDTELPTLQYYRCENKPSSNGRCRYHSGAMTHPGRPITTGVNTKYIIGKVIALLDKADADGVVEVEVFARKLLEHAKAGNPTAIKEILNRIDGPVKTEVEHSGSLDLKTKSDEELIRELMSDPATAEMAKAMLK